MMRNYLRVLLIGLYFVLSQTAFAQETVAPVPAPQYYGMDHGAIEYELAGAESGKEKLFFDQNGLRQARFKTAETLKWGVMNTVTLNLSGDIIYYDPNKGLGQKKQDENFKKLLADPQSVSKGILSLQSVAMMGGKKIGEEKVLDRVCEIWEIAPLKMKLWLWNGIPLKGEAVTLQGPTSYKAVKIDEVTPVDEAVFVVPPEIIFMDRDINQILISRR